MKGCGTNPCLTHHYFPPRSSHRLHFHTNIFFLFSQCLYPFSQRPLISFLNQVASSHYAHRTVRLPCPVLSPHLQCRFPSSHLTFQHADSLCLFKPSIFSSSRHCTSLLSTNPFHLFLFPEPVLLHRLAPTSPTNKVLHQLLFLHKLTRLIRSSLLTA